MQRRAAGARGFSLIELMVVVTIMSVLTLGVLWGTGATQSLSPSARGADPSRQAMAFENSVAEAIDLAAFTRQPVGLRPRPQGWQVLRRNPEGVWLPAGSGVTELRDMQLLWQIGGRSHQPAPAPGPEDAPAIRLLPDGRSTAFSLRLVPQQGGPRPWLCIGDGQSRPACDPV